MSNDQKKTLKAHRAQLQKRGLRRVEVTVHSQDVGLVRGVAAALREDGERARWMRNALQDAAKQPTEPTIAELMSSLPDVPGPEVDAIFEETEHVHHDPATIKVRDR